MQFHCQCGEQFNHSCWWAGYANCPQCNEIVEAGNEQEDEE